jgi:hypothetical protein
MDVSKALIVIGIILIVVIGFNVVIYFSARGKHSINEIDILQKATKKIRHPWDDEETMLSELSQRVKKLQANTSDQEEEK